MCEVHFTIVESRGCSNSILVLVGKCYWEFESGLIRIPIFKEKVTHSYSNRSDFGQILTKITQILKLGKKIEIKKMK